MHRRGIWTSPTCPRCQEEEDHTHIIKCQSTHGTATFHEAWGLLDDWIEKTSSDAIGMAVYTLLTDYRNNEQPRTEAYQDWPPALTRAYNHQLAAGPRSFQEGMLVKDWADAQAEYYVASNNTKNCADHWVSQLIHQLHQMMHTLWKGRCTYVHDKHYQETLYRHDYAIQLKELLADPPPASMPATDRRYFIPLNQALTQHIRSQRRTIRQLRTFIRAHEIRMNTRNARIMRDWLATAHPT